MTRSLGKPVVLILLALLLVLPGLLAQPMTRHQELRVALASRHMAQGESWLVPQFRGEPRLLKPPLMYWMTAPFLRATGLHHHHAVPRLPTLLCGIALLLVIARGGAWLVGRDRAQVAAVVAVSSWLFIRYAGLGETDIPLALLTTLAMLLVYSAQASGRTSTWLWAGFCCGAGFLVKGPAAILIPALTFAAYVGLRPLERARVTWRGVLLALALAAAVALPWYLAILGLEQTQSQAGSTFAGELKKLLAESEHPGPVYYYIFKLPLTMLPWGLLLPLATWAIWPRARNHRGTHYLVIWWTVSFCLLSASASKQEHYTVLLLPPTALLLGWFIKHAETTGGKKWQPWMPRFMALCGTGSLLAGLAGWAFPFLEASGVALSTTALPGVLLIGCGILMIVRRGAVSALPVAALIMAMWVGASSYQLLLYPRLKPEATLVPFAAEAREALPDKARVFAAGRHLTSLEFYLDRRLVEVARPDEGWNKAKRGDAVVVLERPGREFGDAGLSAKAVVDVSRNGARGRLYLKE